MGKIITADLSENIIKKIASYLESTYINNKKDIK